MVDATTLLSFGLASAALIVVPGPTMMYIVARSIEQGKQAGLASIWASFVAATIHFISAGLGLSAILMTSATAFSVVKYAGVFYLLYLGIQKLRSQELLSMDEVVSKASLSTVFYQSVAVHTLNPKAAIFFLAFLPQFLDPARGPLWQQLVPLWLVYTSIGLCIDGSCAVVAGRVRQWMVRHPLFVRREKYVTGGTYIALGLAAATASPSQK